jgi:histidine kinase 2/3/4 (cytokinin receptor)
MLTNGTGLLSASASKNMNMNHSGGGSTKLAVKWWSRSAKKQNSSTCPQIGKTWHTKALVIWVLAAFIVSLYIFRSMNTDIIERRNEVLVSMCDERARMLQDQFAVSMNHVHALAILVSTFHHRKQPSAIDQKTFAEYTARTAFERPLMSGVAYAQKVLHVEREKFERQQGWTIKMMKSKEPSPVQDEYAPAIFSQETISYIASLDMMSGEEDRENILRARATGKAVLTSPFRLLESNHLGVVLTFAVYDTDLSPDATEEERIKATAGYLGGAFDVESLVENLLRKLAGNQAIVVNVYDITNNSMPLIMYGPQVKENDMSHVSSLDFGDPFRKHEMHCRFQQKSPVPWSAITTSIGVFVIAFLIGHILYAAVNHIAKVEDDFRKMEELKVRAEAADVAKSQFLATVSHEIRTPMNGVLGMLQMLLDTDLDATQQDYARTAQASGKALITLINEVLDRAKIESGRLELETVPFDLRAILDDVLSLFSGKTRDKGIELAVFVSDQVPEVLIGDPGRFRQIITNLVGNSVKFTEHGHIFVHVHLAERVKPVWEANAEAYSERATEEVKTSSKSSFNTLSGFQAADGRSSWETFKLLLSDGIHQQLGTSDKGISLETSNSVNLVVIVEDTGIGIPLHAQERVFMPFMQADSSTSRTYGGTGIGLSISRCLVELMGGDIKFVSHPHIGSTFTFTALLRKSDANSLDDLKRPQSESLPTGFTGMKAVVVDGRHVRAQVTKYHLQRLGVQVEVAYDIKSALAVISGRRNGDICSQTKMTDMILVDKESWGPGMGLTFPQLLRDSIPNGRGRLSLESLKMILLATSITSPESEKAKAAGFVETVIMKPLRASMVAACLQQELGLGSKRQQGKGLMDGPPFLRSLLFGKKILVVDDNRVNRRVAAGALKKYGANVECAESGKAAIAMLQLPHKFDACFMDVQMPEMDGFEATRQIRNMEEKVNKQIESGTASKEAYGNVRKWHVPIFAMTADVIQATYEECLRCGMDGYVSKPFEEEELYRAVAQFCESNPSSRS